MMVPAWIRFLGLLVASSAVPVAGHSRLRPVGAAVSGARWEHYDHRRAPGQ
jgi:hypothetical protein